MMDRTGLQSPMGKRSSYGLSLSLFVGVSRSRVFASKDCSSSSLERILCLRTYTQRVISAPAGCVPKCVMRIAQKHHEIWCLIGGLVAAKAWGRGHRELESSLGTTSWACTCPTLPVSFISSRHRNIRLAPRRTAVESATSR